MTVDEFLQGKFVVEADGSEVREVTAVLHVDENTFVAVKNAANGEIDIQPFERLCSHCYFFNTAAEAQEWIVASEADAADEAA